jgi:lysophospholipase L1-like esterase
MMRLIKNISLMAASALFALLLAEGVLHAFPGLLPVEVRQVFNNKGMYHPEIGNLPEPGSSGEIVTRDFESPYKLDSNGFRNDSPWPGRAEIVAIGDSLVFGYGVDVSQAWPQQLSGLTGRNVVNMGLIGASPQQYRKIHETFAQTLSPDIVVVGFFARNDFWDADKYATWESSGVSDNYLDWRGFGSPTSEQYQNPIYRVLFELRQRSYVLAIVKIAKDAILAKDTVKATELTLVSGAKMLLHGDDFREKTRFASSDNRTFETVVEELRKIKKAADQNGSRLIVLFQPGKEEIYAETKGQPAPDPSRRLRDRLDQYGIEYINAIPLYRDLAERGEELFFPTDGHPNAHGYAVLAELVAKHIEGERELHANGERTK